MKPVDTSQCLCHILVCVNRRQDSPLPSCAGADAEPVFETFQSWLSDRNLLARIWLTRTQCMGWCHVDGTTVAFYPADQLEPIWYRAVKKEDCHTLIDRHLKPLIGSTP